MIGMCSIASSGAEVVRDPHSGRSKGIAFVEFYQTDSLFKALELNGAVTQASRRMSVFFRISAGGRFSMSTIELQTEPSA